MKYNEKLKREVMTHYGPDGEIRCSWGNCSIDDIDMLSIDHINGNGNKDRRLTGRAGGAATHIAFCGVPDSRQVFRFYA